MSPIGVLDAGTQPSADDPEDPTAGIGRVVESLSVAAFTIPTDGPESDGLGIVRATVGEKIREVV